MAAQAFVILNECCLLMSNQPNPSEVVSLAFEGYSVGASVDEPFESATFKMLLTEQFEDALAKVRHTSSPKDSMRQTLELIFLLFHTTKHVVTTALGKTNISDEDCYSFVQRMSEPTRSAADIQAILVQFCFAFPTDEAIREWKSMLCKLWLSSASELDHRAALFLEVTCTIGSLRIADQQRADNCNLSTCAVHQMQCKSIMEKLGRFHSKSLGRRWVKFTMKLLSRSDRVKKNNDAPLFWYQSLLGRIAQMRLTKKPTATANETKASRKRKQEDYTTINYGTDMQLRHWTTTRSMFFPQFDHVPSGLPLCLLVPSRNRPTPDSRVAGEPTLPHRYRDELLSCIATLAKLEARLTQMTVDYGGDSPLPISHCKSANSLATHILNELDSNVHWDEAEDQVHQASGITRSVPLHQLGSQDDFPVGYSQEMGLTPLEVEFSQT